MKSKKKNILKCSLSNKNKKSDYKNSISNKRKKRNKEKNKKLNKESLSIKIILDLQNGLRTTIIDQKKDNKNSKSNIQSINMNL